MKIFHANWAIRKLNLRLIIRIPTFRFKAQRGAEGPGF
jgi:hypothetical protein